MKNVGFAIGLASAVGFAGAGLSLSTAGAADMKQWWPVKVEAWNPSCANGDAKCWADPANAIGKRKIVDYVPLPKAEKKWNICASFPHLKDSYWVGADYGIIEEAKRLGVKLTLVEAGGYTNLPKQISQIEDCVAAGAQAVIIGAISGDGNAKSIDEIRKKGVKVIDLINGVNTMVDAKSLVSYHDMAYVACKWVVDKSAGKGKVKVGWFPGPPGAGWSVAGDQGCQDAVKGSNVELVATKWGDTGKEVQLKLVEDVLQTQTKGNTTDLQYIVGVAPAAEAAVSALRDRGLSKDIQVVAYYYTPGMQEMIGRGAVAAAPTDQTVIQSRIAVDQAVRLLEGKPPATGGTPAFGMPNVKMEQIGPQLFVVDKSNFKSFDPTTTLAPEGFKPEFTVN